MKTKRERKNNDMQHKSIPQGHYLVSMVRKLTVLSLLSWIDSTSRAYNEPRALYYHWILIWDSRNLLSVIPLKNMDNYEGAFELCCQNLQSLPIDELTNLYFGEPPEIFEREELRGVTKLKEVRSELVPKSNKAV